MSFVGSFVSSVCLSRICYSTVRSNFSIQNYGAELPHDSFLGFSFIFPLPQFMVIDFRVHERLEPKLTKLFRSWKIANFRFYLQIFSVLFDINTVSSDFIYIIVVLESIYSSSNEIPRK